MAFGDSKGSLTANVGSVTNPTNLTGSVVVAVGDLVFVDFGQQTALTATNTVTDNLGNTYVAVNAGTDAGSVSIRCWYSRVTVAGTLTQISVPATASTNDAAAVATVFEGPFAPGTTLDANPANVTDGTSPYTAPATGTLVQNNEAVIAAIAFPGNQAISATSPAVLAGSVARANVSVAISVTVVSATTSVTPEFTIGAAGTSGLTTASFRRGLIASALTTAGAELGTPSITQTHLLGAPTALTTAGAVLGTPNLYSFLDADDLTTAGAVLGTPTATEIHTLDPDDLTTAGVTLGTPTLTEVNVLDPNDLTTAGAALDAPTFGQTHLLDPDDLTSAGAVLGSPEIIPEMHPDDLTTAGAVLGTPTLEGGQTYNLDADDLTTAGAALGTPSIVQTHLLDPDDITTTGAELGTSTLSQTHLLTATDLITGVPEIGSPGSGADELIASNLTTAAPLLGTPTIGGTHLLDPDDFTTAGANLGTPSIGQTHGLVSATLTTSGPSFGQPPIGQTHVLVAVDIETLWPDIDDAILDGAVPEAGQNRRRKFAYDYAYTNDRWSD